MHVTQRFILPSQMLATSKTLSIQNNLRASPCHGMGGWSNLPFPTFLRQQLLPAPVRTKVICSLEFD